MIKSMKAMEKYKEIRDFFSSLPVVNELSGNNKVYVKKYKTDDSLTIISKTTLEKYQKYSMLNYHFRANKEFFYFPFTVTLNKLKFEVKIDTLIPWLLPEDNPGFGSFISRTQAEKMYKNGLAFDLKKRFKRVDLESDFKGLKLTITLNDEDDYTAISNLYNETSKIAMKVYGIVKTK